MWGQETLAQRELGQEALVKPVESYSSYVPCRVGQAGIGKTLQAKLAGIAVSAGLPLAVGVVATMGQTVVDTQFDAFQDNLGF